MSIEAITLIVILSVIVVAFIISKINPKFEKYWKYLLILLPAVFVLIFKLFVKKKQDDGGQGPGQDSAFKETLTEVKEDMNEAKTIAEVKFKYSKERKKEKLKELETVTKIKSKSERRRKLAEMIG